MGEQDGRAAAGLWQVAGIALALFLGVVIAVAAVAKTFTTLPAIGDIVLLQPDTAVPRTFRIDIEARRTDGAAATACLLQPEIMAKAGGSLVVETRGPGPQPIYRVHWAGAATSAGASDCGASAELEIAASDLRHLAQIAGGTAADPSPYVEYPGSQVAQN